MYDQFNEVYCPDVGRFAIRHDFIPFSVPELKLNDDVVTDIESSQSEKRKKSIVKFCWFQACLELDGESMNPSARAVLYCLTFSADYYGTDKSGWFTVSQRTLVRETSLSEKTVQREITYLKQNGWIMVDRRKVRQCDCTTANFYRLLFQKQPMKNIWSH